MCADPLEPRDIDRGHIASIEPGGFGELSAHQPRRWFLAQGRARKDSELDAARAQIPARFFGFAADIAKQSGQKRSMHHLITGWLLVWMPAHLRNQYVKLSMQIAPLTQAQVGEEILGACLRELPVGFLVFERIVEKRPDLLQAGKLGTLVLELRMRGIGELL